MEGVIAVAISVATGSLGTYFLIRRWLRRRRALKAIDLEQVDKMSGQDFERYMARVFKYRGYRVKSVGGPGDQGCDLILARGGELIACQLKCYNDRKVDNKAVQQAVTAKTIYRCHRAMVVTNSTFNESAKYAAERTACELVDRQQLGALIDSYRGRRTKCVTSACSHCGVQPKSSEARYCRNCGSALAPILDLDAPVSVPRQHKLDRMA